MVSDVVCGWVVYAASPSGELIKRLPGLGMGMRRWWAFWSCRPSFRVSTESLADGRFGLRISWSGPV